MTSRQRLSLVLVSAVIFWPIHRAAAEEFTNALRAWMQQRVEEDADNSGLVVGLVDERGSSVVSDGKTGNGSGLNGDTVFDISFLTKSFTALLLQEMADHRQLALRDPISAHLPASLKIPPHNGRPITVLDLAVHTFGVPDAPGLAEFLAPAGMKSEPKPNNLFYTAGMALLGQIMARQAGIDYESLVIRDICQPLGMDSTRINLTPELRARYAIGHDGGVQSAADGLNGLIGGAGLHSTANDMLKYLSAQLGLTSSPLSSAMKKTHVEYDRDGPFFGNGLAWVITRELDGREVIWLLGRGKGCCAFAAMEPERRRAVIVLANSEQVYRAYLAGMLSLQSEWRPERRQQTAEIKDSAIGSFLGKYQLAPNFALGLFIERQFLHFESRAWLWLPSVSFALVVCLAFTRAKRRWAAILSGAVIFVIVAALSLTWTLSHMACSLFQPGAIIRRDGQRLTVRLTLDVNRRLHPIASRLFPGFPSEFWPTLPFEILPRSDNSFFDRLTGAPLSFSHSSGGKSILTARISGADFTFAKID